MPFDEHDEFGEDETQDIGDIGEERELGAERDETLDVETDEEMTEEETPSGTAEPAAPSPAKKKPARKAKKAAKP